MKELHQKHNDDQTLKKKLDEMRVREANWVKRIGDLQILNNILEKNLHHVHEKINATYEHMNKSNANDCKAEGTWE